MKREIYEAPEVGAVEITTRGILCESGTEAAREGYGVANALYWD